MNGEVVRKSLDIDPNCDLSISVVKDNSRHQDSKEVLRTDKGVPAFRTLFKGMDNNPHSDHFLMEFKCLGRIESMKNNKGMTLIEAIITIICIVIIVLWLYTMSKYGNKPVSEMPIWLYWLLH